jgi:hypothetical protein
MGCNYNIFYQEQQICNSISCTIICYPSTCEGKIAPYDLVKLKNIDNMYLVKTLYLSETHLDLCVPGRTSPAIKTYIYFTHEQIITTSTLHTHTYYYYYTYRNVRLILTVVLYFPGNRKFHPLKGILLTLCRTQLKSKSNPSCSPGLTPTTLVHPKIQLQPNLNDICIDNIIMLSSYYYSYKKTNTITTHSNIPPSTHSNNS